MNRPALLSTLIFLLAVNLAAGQARADIYVYTSADGVRHYTNKPERPEFHLIVAVLKEEGRANRAQALPKANRVAEYAPYVEASASEFGLDSALVHAVITAESGYNPAAVSRVGAQGLMQLMPETARRYAVKDSFDPAQNIRGGTRYLRDLLDLFESDVTLAVAAYNAGENAVIKYGMQIPPYRETMAYVPKVMGLYQKYKAAL